MKIDKNFVIAVLASVLTVGGVGQFSPFALISEASADSGTSTASANSGNKNSISRRFCLPYSFSFGLNIAKHCASFFIAIYKMSFISFDGS